MLAGAFSGTRTAAAQVRWDASAQVGASKRFLTSAFVQPRVGPAAQLVGHVALLPLLRLGAYGGYEVSPVGDGPARRIVSLGVRGKVDAPWGSRVLHGYAFVGGGFASVYGPSATVTLRSAGIGGGAPVTESATLPGASGALLEIPLGVGLAVRLRRPWELLFELSGRASFGLGGDLYEGRTATSPVQGLQTLAPIGNDRFGLLLTVGLGIDR